MNDHRCMRDIAAAEVVEAATRLLDRNAIAAPR
jgi:hypothetical protein